jgi:DNA transposition AAA+ family ATPase
VAVKVSGRVDVGRLVKTPDFQEAQDLAMSTVDNCGISVFDGAPGLGKTVAACSFQATVEDRQAVYLAAAGRPSVTALARSMAEQLTGIADLQNEMLYSVRETLHEVLWADNHPLVIIDEAQRLSVDHFEFLRDLHDDKRSSFPLLLVGNDDAWRVISQRPMLQKRIWHRLHFEPLATSDVGRFLPRYDGVYATASDQVLSRVADLSGGEFRWLAMFTALAHQVMERAGAETLDDTIVSAVLLRMARSAGG